MSHEIRTLAEGEKISEPGFYNISLDRHHSQPCMTPDRLKEIIDGDRPRVDECSVTSGVLRKMELETPADVWAFHLLNPKRWEQEDKTALRLGRAMAAYVEGGMDEVEKHFAVLPEEKPRKPTAQQREAYKAGTATATGIASVEFWDAVEADTRDPLTASDQKMIEDMGMCLAADPAAAAVMSGIPEITMAYQCDRTGLWVLSRPDTVSFDGSISDYKKASSEGRPFNYRLCDRKIEQFAYHQQMALAAEAMEYLTKSWPEIVSVVFQSDKPPHHVIIREIGEEELRMGQFLNRRALTRFAECLQGGKWPGPGDDIGAFQMSKWMRENLLEQMQTAGKAP